MKKMRTSTFWLLEPHLTETNPELSLTEDDIRSIKALYTYEQELEKMSRENIGAVYGQKVVKLLDGLENIKHGNYDGACRHAKLIALAENITEPIEKHNIKRSRDIQLILHEDFLKNIRGTYSVLEIELQNKIDKMEKEIYCGN